MDQSEPAGPVSRSEESTLCENNEHKFRLEKSILLLTTLYFGIFALYLAPLFLC